ncbi:hypothetical protein PFISCL1PPCAC_8681, partial [Pristionchus fissidentatus]
MASKAQRVDPETNHAPHSICRNHRSGRWNLARKKPKDTVAHRPFPQISLIFAVSSISHRGVSKSARHSSATVLSHSGQYRSEEERERPIGIV